jgi:hypothetical protein
LFNISQDNEYGNILVMVRNKCKIIDVMKIKKASIIGGNFVAVQGLPACSRPKEGQALRNGT